MSKYFEVVSCDNLFAGELFHIAIDKNIQVIELINCVQMINNDLKYKDSLFALTEHSTIYKYYDHKIILNVCEVKDISSNIFKKILANVNIECCK